MQKRGLHTSEQYKPKEKRFTKTNFYIFAACLLAGLLATYFYTHFGVPEYKMSVLIHIKKKDAKLITDHDFKEIADWFSLKAQNDTGKNLVYTARFVTSKLPNVKNGLELTTQTKEPKKNRNYLSKSISAFNSNYHVDVSRQVNQLSDSVQTLIGRLSVLRADLKLYDPNMFAKQVALIKSQKDLYVKQASIFDYILSYINRPAQTFVIIPDSFDPHNDQIKELISQFNNLQHVRQELISVSSRKYTDGLTKTNDRLTLIKNQIRMQIDAQKRHLNQSVDSLTNTLIKFKSTVQNRQNTAVITSKIYAIKSLIDTLNQKKYALLTATQYPTLEITEGRANVTEIENNDYSTYLYAALISLVTAGLLIYILTLSKKFLPGKGNFKRSTRDFSDININDLSPLIAIESANPIHEVAKHILQSRNVPTSQLITVTAPDDADEITYFSIHLANQLKNAGNKVIVVDFDLQDPHLLERINLTYAKGVKTFLDGKTISVDDLIVKSANYEKLSFIGAGPRNAPKDNIRQFINVLNQNWENDDETLIDHDAIKLRFTSLISQLKERFDYIILQVPDFDPKNEHYFINELTNVTVLLSPSGSLYKAKVSSFIHQKETV